MVRDAHPTMLHVYHANISGKNVNRAEQKGKRESRCEYEFHFLLLI
jgi:hypothetical protein